MLPRVNFRVDDADGPTVGFGTKPPNDSWIDYIGPVYYSVKLIASAANWLQRQKHMLAS